MGHYPLWDSLALSRGPGPRLLSILPPVGLQWNHNNLMKH